MLNRNCKVEDSQTPKIKIAIATYMSSISKRKRSTKLLNKEAGFTILESLVAAAVVSILIVAIAPMVALSTSARVNARRIDQATQAARSYVDAVRGGVIDTTSFPSNLVLPPQASSANAQSQYTFESILAPTTTNFPPSTICTNPYPPAPTAAVNNVPLGKVPGICVDAGGGGWSKDDPQDLFIQPMRSGGTDATTLKKQGFWLAVRVYRADALAGSALLRQGTEDSCAQSRTAFSSTASITCPIVTVRSQILPTTNANNLNDIKLGTGSKP